MTKPFDNLTLTNDHWTAEVSLYGGQMLQCRHQDSAHPVIWLGKQASFAPGTAIRGGIPLCWPWFGASPYPDRPPQGFARLYDWEIAARDKDFIRMILPEAKIPLSLRDFPFELSTEIRLADYIEISLDMKNCGDHPVELSMALHTYLAVSDCEQIEIRGLENIPHTVKNGPEQPGESLPLRCQGECCRLYYPHSGTAMIVDPIWKRAILLEKCNSNSTLIWNPGAERAAQIPDLGPGEYKGMVCVEANRAGADKLLLQPGIPVCLKQKIRLFPS